MTNNVDLPAPSLETKEGKSRKLRKSKRKNVKVIGGGGRKTGYKGGEDFEKRKEDKKNQRTFITVEI